MQLYGLGSHSREKELWEAQTSYCCSGAALNPSPCVSCDIAVPMPSRLPADQDLSGGPDFPA